MIKILYIPTGNTFVLPDDEALRIMSNARGNYKVLEGGLQKEVEEKLEPETVKELVMQKPQEVLEEEVKEEEAFDYMSCTKHEAFAYAKRLGIKGIDKSTRKEEIQAKIKEKIGK